MADLANLQEKIRRGYPLTASEEAYVLKAANEKGEPSRRKWTGLKEHPKSVIDFKD